MSCFRTFEFRKSLGASVFNISNVLVTAFGDYKRIKLCLNDGKLVAVLKFCGRLYHNWGPEYCKLFLNYSVLCLSGNAKSNLRVNRCSVGRTSAISARCYGGFFFSLEHFSTSGFCLPKNGDFFLFKTILEIYYKKIDRRGLSLEALIK